MQRITRVHPQSAHKGHEKDIKKLVGEWVPDEYQEMHENSAYESGSFFLAEPGYYGPQYIEAGEELVIYGAIVEDVR